MTASQVLVVDPNPSVLKRVMVALEGCGCEVLSARDCVEAEICTAGRRVGVVVSATDLPRGNGYDLAESVLAINPEAKIFLIASKLQPYDWERARKVGVTAKVDPIFSSDAMHQLLEQSGALAMVTSTAHPQGIPDRILAASGADYDDDSEITVPSPYRPLEPEERVATILPRNYTDVPSPGALTSDLSAAVEKAVVAILPEVLEGVLRNHLDSSTEFRDLVNAAVERSAQASIRKAHADLNTSGQTVHKQSMTNDTDSTQE